MSIPTFLYSAFAYRALELSIISCPIKLLFLVISFCISASCSFGIIFKTLNTSTPCGSFFNISIMSFCSFVRFAVSALFIFACVCSSTMTQVSASLNASFTFSLVSLSTSFKRYTFSFSSAGYFSFISLSALEEVCSS